MTRKHPWVLEKLKPISAAGNRYYEWGAVLKLGNAAPGDVWTSVSRLNSCSWHWTLKRRLSETRTQIITINTSHLAWPPVLSHSSCIYLGETVSSTSLQVVGYRQGEIIPVFTRGLKTQEWSPDIIWHPNIISMDSNHHTNLPGAMPRSVCLRRYHTQGTLRLPQTRLLCHKKFQLFSLVIKTKVFHNVNRLSEWEKECGVLRCSGPTMQWTVLGSMTRPQYYYHSLSIVSRIRYVAGGYPRTKSVDPWRNWLVIWPRTGTYWLIWWYARGNKWSNAYYLVIHPGVLGQQIPLTLV